MDNYEIADLSVNYALGTGQKVFVRIDNLFDEDYEEVPGFGAARLSAFAGLEVDIY